MIFNKYISLVLSACFFLFLMFLTSTVVMNMSLGSLIMPIFVVLVIIFFVLSRIFYYYLRSDDKYKNTRKRSSDKKGERYITKGETDIKKIFVIVWVLVMLVLLLIILILHG